MVSRICRQRFRVGVANALFSSILTLGLGLKGAVTKKLLQTKIKPVHDNLNIFLFDGISLSCLLLLLLLLIFYIYIYLGFQNKSRTCNLGKNFSFPFHRSTQLFARLLSSWSFLLRLWQTLTFSFTFHRSNQLFGPPLPSLCLYLL